MDDVQTIFVAMPSFRDSECIHTLDDLFNKASRPENITVGVYDQYSDATRLSEKLEGKWYKNQIRIDEVPCAEAKGSGWAWSKAHALMQDEAYTLNIHAHMRFVDGWDIKLLEQYEACPSDKKVLSYFLPPYKPPYKLYDQPKAKRRICVYSMDKRKSAQLLHLDYTIIDDEDPRQSIYPTPFIVFNFVFAQSKLFKELPLDPHIYFWGEEIAYSARLWTHGYDVFQPEESIAFHQWHGRDKNIVDDFRQLGHPSNKFSYQRLCILLSLDHHKGDDPIEGCATDLDQYALGRDRPMEDWYRFAGVDFNNRTLTEEAASGMWDISKLKNVPAYLQATQPQSQVDFALFPTIFIAIPSYVDRQCVATIKRLFEAADKPENIRVGVCWQSNDEFGPFPMDEFADYQDQIRVVEVDAAKAKGANWARMEAYKLRHGENFTLLIDAHMHFIDGWDRFLIDSHKAAGDDRAVLTYFCPPFTPQGNFVSKDQRNRRIVANYLGKEGDPQLVHLTRAIIDRRDSRFDRLYPSPFVAHHFIFGPGDVFERLPLDPNIRFWGDELTLSLRLWTHGCRIYQLPNLPAFHQWFEREEEGAKLTYREIKNQAAKDNAEYVKMVLGLEHHSDKVLQGQYSLGNVRDVAGFWQFSGVDLERRQIAPHGKSGLWDLSVFGEASENQPRRIEGHWASGHLASGEKAAKRASQPQNNASDMVQVNTDKRRLLVCISASDNKTLAQSLISLVDGADSLDGLRIAVAWHGEAMLILPNALSDRHVGGIVDVKHVAGGVAGNAFKDATALWQQEDYIAFVSPGVEFVQGWNRKLKQELSRLKKQQLLTSISADGEAHQRIAAGALEGGYQDLLIASQPVEATDETSAETPLASFMLLAGTSENMLACLPDPHMDMAALELVHSARLWTHGFDVVQPQNPLLASYQPQVDAVEDIHQASIQRAQHMLGLNYTEQEVVLIDLDRFGHGEVRETETFWRALGVNVENETIHPQALKGHWNKLLHGQPRLNGKHMEPILAAKPVEAASVKDSRYHGVKIFVQIASYRDEQCQYTVQDMFAKAKYPDRVFAGIIWQSVPEEDQECFKVITRPEQVRVTHFDARESKGACWARHHGQKLWQGEEFTLQIDSHMRFEKHWDEMLLNMYERIGREKAVLTTYPSGFTPPDKLNPKVAYRLAAKEFNEQGIFTMRSRKIDMQKHHAPLPGAFMSACMLFGPASIIQDVPYDPYLYFFGEEISLSVRLWTHGYDIYHPDKHIVWHDWKRENRKSTHFKDHDWQKLNRKSFARVRFLLAGQNPQRQEVREYVRQELDTYGLGSQRSLRAFETYAGISFANRVITDRANRGDFSFEAPYSEQQQARSISAQPALGDVAVANGSGLTNYAQVNQGQVPPNLYTNRFQDV